MTESGIKERVMQFIEYLNISVTMFESQVGLATGSVKKMGSKTRAATFNRIAERYPQVNKNWLRFGEGEMLSTISIDKIDKIDVGDQKIGDNSRYSANDPKMYLRALDEISAQRKFAERMQSDLESAHEMVKESHDKLVKMAEQVLKLSSMIKGNGQEKDA